MEVIKFFLILVTRVVDILEHLRGQCLLILLPKRLTGLKCEVDVLNVPLHVLRRTSTVMYNPGVALKFLSCHRWRRNVMNAPSCHRHKCSHRLLQHIGHRLTQMCFDDGSSFFPLICLFFFFLQYAKDLWTNRLKISSNQSPVLKETRLNGESEGEGR